MQNREKYLAIILLSTVVLWQAGPMLHNWFIAPIEARLGQIKTIKKRLRKNEDFEFELIRAKSTVKNAEWQSLPPNSLDAQRMYQSWLTDMAQLAELNNIQVKPSRRNAQGQFYVAVQVELEAEGTYHQLTQFLYSFYRSDLLQRIVRLNVESTSSQGDPILNIALTAEGLSLRDAKPRKYLFPETYLVTAIEEHDHEITVVDKKGFPNSPPFQVRIGNEFLQVTEVMEDHRWLVERGFGPTHPQKHNANSEVQYAPANETYANRSWSDFKQHLASNHFVIPEPPKSYSPRIKSIPDQQIVRGSSLQVHIEIQDWNPAWGPPHYELITPKKAPAGLSMNADTGQLDWKIPDDYEPQTIPVTVVVKPSKQGGKHIPTSFRVSVFEPNRPPVVQPVADQNVFAGQSWLFAIDAHDPDQNNLKYSLGGETPEGLDIDALTGLIAWSPGVGTRVGVYPVHVVVTDDGQPNQQTLLKFNVNIREDDAQYTYMVASVSADEDRFAWLYNRANNKKTVLQIDNHFDIAGVKATVTAIEKNHLLFQIDKAVYRMQTGDNLRAVLQDGPIKTQTAQKSK